ncbi:MAG TPA: hypothetical protein VFL98_04005 [Candidatus Paceibacterota bacterium]|nr:hypothetical protein [Candidatus Paceibacterota bacterium]
MQNNRNLLVGIGAAVIIIIIAAVLYAHAVGQGKAPVDLGTSAVATSSIPAEGTSSTSTAASSSADGLPVIPGATVTPIYATSTGSAGPKAPEYAKPLSYAGISADVAAAYQTSFTEAQAALAKDATDWAAWISLAQLRTATGDYAGAEADLTYITALYPKDPTAYANLGDLYANYEHEPAKAVAAYQEAISLDPVKQAQLYANLADALIAEGKTVQAKATLQAGIDAKVVGYQSLETKLSSLQ